jgi:hypothetical protein
LTDPSTFAQTNSRDRKKGQKKAVGFGNPRLEYRTHLLINPWADFLPKNKNNSFFSVDERRATSFHAPFFIDIGIVNKIIAFLSRKIF